MWNKGKDYDSELKEYRKKFHSHKTKTIINLFDCIIKYNAQAKTFSDHPMLMNESHVNLHNSKMELLNMLSLDHLSNLERIFLGFTLEGEILASKDEKRDTGEPYFIHPWSVGYQISKSKLDSKLIAASFLHDRPESDVEKMESKHLSLEERVKFTNQSIQRHYTLLREFLNHSKSNKSVSSSDLQGFDPKYLLKIALMINKDTRYESDKDYGHSIKRITDEDISFEKLEYSRIFYESLFDRHGKETINSLVSSRREKFGESRREARKRVMRSFSSELTLTPEEIFEINAGAAIVKCGDRYSNSNAFKDRSFSDKFKDLYKNLYLIHEIADYSQLKKAEFSSHPLYIPLLEKGKETRYISKRRIDEEIDDLIQNNKRNPEFKSHMKHYDSERTKFLAFGGFNQIDSSKSDQKLDPEIHTEYVSNVYYGFVFDLCDKLMTKEKEVMRTINETPELQYLILTGLKELVNVYERGEKIKNFEDIYIREKVDGLRI